MFDNSVAVIAFFYGKNYFSGTGQTVRYAEQRNKSVCMFSMNDVYSIMKYSSTDKNAIRAEKWNISLNILKPMK
ncbi:MAG: hypothetical protein K2J37_05895 [Ruminococcus sp.]|nr:hypothetical protein [Ruminococcus sp.]MDE6784264.1 hypothetical protein [Ruminococcus sp.]